jgi:hypothetical protein
VATVHVHPNVRRTARRHDRARSGWRAGALAAVAQLGCGELLAALLPSARSPVSGLGQILIDFLPGPGVDMAVAAVQAKDKALLRAALVASALGSGYLATRVEAQGRGRGRWLLAGQGLIGGAAAASRPSQPAGKQAGPCPMETELWKCTAAELAAAVAEGEVSAADVVESHLARIAGVNPVVNAVTQTLADIACRDADEIDRRRVAGQRPGPLAGVPFTVKENIGIGGVPTTHGLARFREMRAPADAPPVARLRAAGAIPIGHSNMPDLTLGGMHPRSELFGETSNPWHPGRTPGGSSGGDGAAVASGMAPLGLGNDSGGSIRIPAAFCGTTGLKPTYGRFPADHRIGPDDPTLASQLMPVDGPLARTVGDLRLAYEALAGTDPRDPRAVPAPL